MKKLLALLFLVTITFTNYALGSPFIIEPSSPPFDGYSETDNLSSLLDGTYYMVEGGEILSIEGGVSELTYYYSPIWDFTIKSESGEVGLDVQFDLSFNVRAGLSIYDSNGISNILVNNFNLEYPIGVYMIDSTDPENYDPEFMQKDDFLYDWTIGTTEFAEFDVQQTKTASLALKTGITYSIGTTIALPKDMFTFEYDEDTKLPPESSLYAGVYAGISLNDYDIKAIAEPNTGLFLCFSILFLLIWIHKYPRMVVYNEK